jgi:phage tail-like protein
MLQKYLLELEGKAAGRFFEMSGGSIKADVITQSLGPQTQRLKHIGGVSYEDILITCGTGMSRAFYNWIGDSFGGRAARRDGAVVLLDYSQAPRARLEFIHSMIKSVSLPQLNHSRNGAAYMEVAISPEFTRTGEAGRSEKPGVYAAALPKAWNISDFRIKIQGLDSDCAHVTQVDGLRLGQTFIEDTSGGWSYSTKEPGRTKYPNLRLRLPGNRAAGFIKWSDDFLVKGNNASINKKRGTLEYFAPNSNKAYFELQFSGLGIWGISSAPAMAAKSAAPLTVEMYCEEMKFKAGPSAVI